MPSPNFSHFSIVPLIIEGSVQTWAQDTLTVMTSRVAEESPNGSILS